MAKKTQKLELMAELAKVRADLKMKKDAKEKKVAELLKAIKAGN